MKDKISYIDTSIFDLFKSGPGPSSSHTIGPMKAAGNFLNKLRQLPEPALRSASSVKVELFGSLSLTGKGHGTDRSIVAGLLGWEPESCDCEALSGLLQLPEEEYRISLSNGHELPFSAADIFFNQDEHDLPYQNTMVFKLLNAQDETILEKTYYSIGGGFIRCDGEPPSEVPPPPYCYGSMTELQTLLQKKRLALPALIFANEMALTGMSTSQISERLNQLIEIMCDAVKRGLRTRGILPGPIRLARKSPQLFTNAVKLDNGPDKFLVLLNAYALAVSEENAAGHRVVTAPTSGSSGVMPAVVYLLRHHLRIPDQELHEGFCAAAAVGFIAKHNASISGAEVGCQGEVGVASAMAAAMATYVRTKNMNRVANAAEIALEHHLGMTCDPIGGYVQIPCIERNAVGAVTAYNACLLASICDPHKQKIGFDEVLAVMLETGRDMCVKYKETSKGGLGVCKVC